MGGILAKLEHGHLTICSGYYPKKATLTAIMLIVLALIILHRGFEGPQKKTFFCISQPSLSRLQIVMPQS